MLFFGSRRFHSWYGFFGETSDYHTCRRGFEWYVASASKLDPLLIGIQDSFHICTTVLVNRCRPVDTLEDSTYQRRALLGLAK
jgi:hypothetical protein